MKKLSYFYYALLTVNILSALAILFFPKAFLFVIFGYDLNLIKMQSLKAIQADAAIRDYYLALNLAFLILSAVTFGLTRGLRSVITKSFHRRYMITGVLCLLALIASLNVYTGYKQSNVNTAIFIDTVAVK